MSGTIVMTDGDLETMKTLARAMAQTTASEVAAKLREELRRDFSDLEERLSKRIDAEMAKRLGQMDAAKHIVQHDRIERLLNWVEQMQGNIWKSLIAQVVKYAVLGVMAWYLIGHGLPK